MTTDSQESAPIRAEPRVRTRDHFTASHFHAANLFALEAKKIEDSEHNPLSSKLQSDHRSYVIGAVITATATLEANINDLFIDAAEQRPGDFLGLPETFPLLMAELWEEVEKAQILRKYQLALACAGKQSMDRGLRYFQYADHLITLRNALVHFKAEWTTEPREHPKLEKRLRGLFSENRYSSSSEPFFPNRCMGAGCAIWAVQAAGNFILEHNRLMGIERGLRDRVVRFDAGEIPDVSAY